MMEYKGYIGQVEFDDEANIFHGEVINLRDVVTFQGATVNELRKAFRDSVDDYIEFCESQPISAVFHGMENHFPRYGKIYAGFSTLWKITAKVFHSVENFFPWHGKPCAYLTRGAGAL